MVYGNKCIVFSSQVPVRLRDGGRHREQGGAGRGQEGGGQGRRRPHLRLREHQKGHPGMIMIRSSLRMRV